MKHQPTATMQALLDLFPAIELEDVYKAANAAGVDYSGVNELTPLIDEDGFKLFAPTAKKPVIEACRSRQGRYSEAPFWLLLIDHLDGAELVECTSHELLHKVCAELAVRYPDTSKN